MARMSLAGVLLRRRRGCLCRRLGARRVERVEQADRMERVERVQRKLVALRVRLRWREAGVKKP